MSVLGGIGRWTGMVPQSDEAEGSKVWFVGERGDGILRLLRTLQCEDGWLLTSGCVADGGVEARLQPWWWLAMGARGWL